MSDDRGNELHDDTGPAVRDGELRYVSVSQLKKFDPEASGGCNRRWWFEKVLGLPSKEIRANVIGKQTHAQIEHTIKTGEQTLGMIALAGKRFIPRPDPRLRVEQCIGDGSGVRAFEKTRTLGPNVPPPARQLHALGIPFVGFIDLVNPTGTFIDVHGVVQEELSGVVEVVDWKTSKDPRRYGKTPYELRHDAQMLGYGRWALMAFPQSIGVRLSHVYFATQGAPEAFKVMTVMSADDIRNEWLGIESVVRDMKRVARVSGIADVVPNWNSCTAFGGCPHRNLCGDRSSSDVIRDLIGLRKNKDGARMSMLDKLKKKTETPKTETKPADVPQVTHSPQSVEAQKKRLLAVEKGSVLPPDAPASGAHAPAAEALPTDTPQPSNIAEAAAKVHTGTVGKGKRGSKQAEAALAAVNAGKSISEGLTGKAPEIATELPVSSDATASVPEPQQSALPAASPAAVPILFVDVVTDGVFAPSLRKYLEEKCAALCSQFGAADLRCAPSDSPLGFGKWKGALAAIVRAEPPPFGVWHINHVAEDERAQVLVATLQGAGFALVRGL